MNTQLNVVSYFSGSFGYRTSGTVNLYEDIPISLNYNIADIKEPQKRNADYSKTITVPGTNANNNLFSHMYDVGIDRLYNPNKKVEARILFNGVQVMKGWLRLARIRTLRNKKIEYDLEITGRLDDLFTTLVDKKLTDLNWTDLNHVYNRTNIIASWSAQVGIGYVYPFIDFGYSLDKITYDVNHFFPALYVKEALDRVFAYAGYQYSSSFLNSNFFKRLIIPFTSDRMKLSASQVQGRQFLANRLTSNQQHVFSTSGTYEYETVIFNNDSVNPGVDAGNNYNNSTGVYTVPTDGYYNFVAKVSLQGVYTPAAAFQYITHTIDASPRILKNNVAVKYGSTYKLTDPTYPNPFQVSSIQKSAIEDQCYVQYSGFFKVGDTFKVDVECKLRKWLSAGPSNINHQLDILSQSVTAYTSYFYATVKPDVTDGDGVIFKDTLPQDMKVVDFLISLLKMFNLYFEYDKNTPNKIYIEPREDYYNNNIQDWSKKLHVGDAGDNSKDPEIIPMGALNAKRYRFTYRKDGDVLNNTYLTTYGENYGERYKDVDNDFLKNHETMELIFSPTPLYSSAASDRIYPAIVNVDSSLKIVHNKTSNPRILYYGGLKSCDSWVFTSLGTVTKQVQYPYCGHLDDPTNPTVDLNFGVPKEIYYTPPWQGAYTNNNIYNVYWKKFIDEITDYNSSIVTAWFWLRPVDVMEIDFRHVYRFMNQNFRLNKVYDYNPSSRSLTKCEFIKLRNGIPFLASSGVVGGASDDLFSTGERFPQLFFRQSQGDNIFEFLGNNSQQVYGQKNQVSPSASRILINGDSNSVGDFAQNINIQSSSGVVVAGGIVNVSVFNTFGVRILESNTNWVNGQKVNGVDRIYDSLQLNDDEYVNIPINAMGYGGAFSFNSDGACDAVVHFRINKFGGVTEMHTGDALNSAIADTDTKLCAFDAGSALRIKNRLGGPRIVMYEIKFMRKSII